MKIEAVKEAFEAVWPDKTWEVEGVEVKSGVANQPMSDWESIKGARNRAKKALKLLKADFGVGLEGGLQQIGRYWFDCGWEVVVDKKGREGVGSSIKMEAPNKVMKMIREGKELGEIIDLIFKRENAKQAEGYFGLMTNKVITRKDGYREGVISALARFLQAQIFK